MPEGHATQLETAPPLKTEVVTQFLAQGGSRLEGLQPRRGAVLAHHASPGEMWSLDTAEELRVPIGRAGAMKLQYLAIGKGTR